MMALFLSSLTPVLGQAQSHESLMPITIALVIICLIIILILWLPGILGND